MRKLIIHFVPAVLLFFWLAACGPGEEHNDHQHDASATESVEAAHGEGKEYTSAYVCPMHCEGSGSEEPGTCPVCGMAYVASSEHTADGHTHQ